MKKNKRPSREDYLNESLESPNLENRTRDGVKKQINQKPKRNWVLLIGGGIFVSLVIGVVLYFLMTGVNDKRVVSLKQEVEKLNNTIANQGEEINDLYEEIEDTTVKEVVPITSLQRVEGSEVPVFQLIEGDFIAPNTLELPEVREDVNDSNIQVGSRFVFTPSENWLMKVRGTTLEFSHPTKIFGKIKALKHEERVSEENMIPILQNFFTNYPATTIEYRKVFIEDRVVGMMAKANITIEGKEKTLNVGFAQRSEYTLNFMFLHDSNNVVGQELIDLLISSGKYSDSNLKLE